MVQSDSPIVVPWQFTYCENRFASYSLVSSPIRFPLPSIVYQGNGGTCLFVHSCTRLIRRIFPFVSHCDS